MNNIESLIRSDLKTLKAYQSASVPKNSENIFLHANESPWENAMDGFTHLLNRYPPQQSETFLQRCADFYRLPPQRIFITRGSDDGIDLLIRLFCQPQQNKLLICPPTFAMYETLANIQGVSVVKIPLHPQTFQLDINKLFYGWQEKVTLVFLCSPNNPTGNVMDPTAVFDLCHQLSGKAMVVIDEAYVEFANTVSFSQYIDAFENLVVLRTFSKALGLAAARVGVVLAHEKVVAWLKKIAPPYSLPSLSLEVALNRLHPKNLKRIQKQIQSIIQEREKLVIALNQLSCTKKVWPSSTNFLLVQFNQDIESLCHQQGIVLRNVEQTTGLPHCTRITVGTPKENLTLLTCLRSL